MARNHANIKKRKNISNEIIFQWVAIAYFLMKFSGNGFYFFLALAIGVGELIYTHFVDTEILKKIYPLLYVLFWIYISAAGKEYTFESSLNLSIFVGLTVFVGYTNLMKETYILSRKQKYIKFLLAIVIAICFFGYRLLIEDVYGGNYYVIIRWVVFLAGILWAYEFINAYEKIMLWWVRRNDKVLTVVQNRKLKIIFFVIFASTGIIMSLIYYPGMISYEGLSIWDDAIHLGDIVHRTEQRSFMLTLLWAIYAHLTNNIFFMTLILVLVMAYIWADFITFLTAKGLSCKLAMAFAIYWTIVPINMFMTITVFKDNFFAICMFAVFVLSIKILWGNENNTKNYIMLIIATILMATFRANAIFALFFLAIMVTIYFIKTKKIFKYWMSIMIASCVVMIYKGPVLNQIELQPSEEGYNVVFMLDGIWECVYQDKKLPEWIENYMYSIVPKDELTEKYVETYTNYFFWEDQLSNTNISQAKTIKAYLFCLKEYPATIIKARFKKCFNLWSVFPPHANEDFRQRIFNEKTVENPYGWEYIEGLQPLRNAFYGYYKDDNIINAIFGFLYRGGLNICILCLVLWSAIVQNKCKIFIIIAPIMGNIVSLWIACCFRDYRYVWPSYIIANALLLFSLAEALSCKEKHVAPI